MPTVIPSGVLNPNNKSRILRELRMRTAAHTDRRITAGLDRSFEEGG